MPRKPTILDVVGGRIANISADWSSLDQPQLSEAIGHKQLFCEVIESRL